MFVCAEVRLIWPLFAQGFSMSYQVLARKWRPRSFDEMVGQAHVLRALSNALEQNRLHHAYLFTGTRGIGKTTVARILAKCLNCETGVTSKPCNTCSACTAIDQGRFVDLIEVDAASRTKVEDTRELLDNVQYAPSSGRFKIYLIDEVHMLSGHSFNALLKTLEEPPPHVKFLLATTDPQKLPVTVLSRCLQFHLKALSNDLITQQLTHILNEEKFTFEPNALLQLARAAKGSMRDALSLLDQAIAFGDGKVNDADVSNMLGTIEQRYLQDLLNALAEKNGEQLLAVTQTLAEQASDFYQVLDELISTLHHTALAQQLPSVTQNELAQQFANRFSPEDIQLYYQIALVGKRDLPYALDAKSGFEMTLLRMLAFEKVDAPVTTKTTATAKPAANKPSAAPQAAPTATAPTAKPATEPTAPAKQQPASNNWTEMAGQLQLSGLAQALANNCELREWAADTIKLAVAPQHAAMLNDKQRQRLNDAINQHLGKKITINIIVDQPQTQTPAEHQQAVNNAKAQAAKQSIESDETVQSLINVFNASIETTKPIDS
jgi:DNA polymerase III subunit gamma/tau